MNLIERQFQYLGRTVIAYYDPGVLKRWEDIRCCSEPPVMYANRPMYAGDFLASRMYLALLVKDAETGEIIKDMGEK